MKEFLKIFVEMFVGQVICGLVACPFIWLATKLDFKYASSWVTLFICFILWVILCAMVLSEISLKREKWKNKRK